MHSFLTVLRAELMKVRWSLMLGVIAVAPVLAFLMRGKPGANNTYQMYYMGVVVVYGWIFYPIVSGLVAALICRTEHLSGGWKQLLALPVRRSDVYLAKYLIVASLLALSQLLVALGLVAMSVWGGIEKVAWEPTALGLLGGWIGVLPLAALQLWASTRWRTFGGPLALNVALTFPALFAVQSEKFAPWYPWGQPVCAMMAPFSKGVDHQWIAFSATTLLVVIVGGFLLAFFGGMLHFVRGDIAS